VAQPREDRYFHDLPILLESDAGEHNVRPLPRPTPRRSQLSRALSHGILPGEVLAVLEGTFWSQNFRCAVNLPFASNLFKINEVKLF